MSSSPKSKSRRPQPTRRSGKNVKGAKLRVIGGEMRGRIVHYHGAEFTRPMKDNIRENLFNILGPRIRGTICFDLFAGTGAMAFESLSRGATNAVLIEQNRKAMDFIRRTAESLEVTSRVQLLTGDAFRLASSLLGPPEHDTPWIVFLCPPYVLWKESLAELNRIIQSTLVNAPPGSVLIAETEKSFDASLLPAADWDFRAYGGTRLAFAHPASQCGLNL